MVAAMATNVARAQYMPHVYINPGHGGHDSDDRLHNQHVACI